MKKSVFVPNQMAEFKIDHTFLISYLMFFFLGVAIPAAIILHGRSYHINLASIGALLIVLLASLRLSTIAYSGKVAPLLLTYWIFVYFWMGLATFAQTFANDFYWLGHYSPWLQTKGVFIILIENHWFADALAAPPQE